MRSRTLMSVVSRLVEDLASIQRRRVIDLRQNLDVELSITLGPALALAEESRQIAQVFRPKLDACAACFAQ